MHHIERSQSTEAGSCLRSNKAQVLEARRESCFGTGGSSLVVMVGVGGRVVVLEDETSTETGRLYHGWSWFSVQSKISLALSKLKKINK